MRPVSTAILTIGVKGGIPYSFSQMSGAIDLNISGGASLELVPLKGNTLAPPDLPLFLEEIANRIL